MPNTKSAERRVRSSARKHLHNQSIASKIRTLERKYLATLAEGKKDAGAAELRTVSSAFDKAVKSGVIARGTANRKKSRLALALKKVK
jgi:small subunit ribosomal protein S20